MALLQDSQPDLCLLAKSGGCSVYQLRNESGEGTMTEIGRASCRERV